MLTIHLLHFTIVIAAQLAFFYIHARTVGELDNVSKYLVQGMLVGLPFGIIFDLVVGKHLGIFSYEFGFELWFLALNGLLSYGFMLANVLLLFRHSIIHAYLWSVGLGFFYELANYWFPVWHWEFASSPALEYLVVIGAAYAGLAWLMMLALRVVYNVQFRLVPF